MSEEKQRWITLYTDANPRGWGAWARADDDHPTKSGDRIIRQTWSGGFDQRLDTTAAEALAIVNGCRLILATWVDVFGIGIKTDSQAAMTLLRFRAKGARRRDLQEIQAQMKSVLGSTIHRIQWVKGHRRDGTVSAYLNNRVDALAAKHR